MHLYSKSLLTAIFCFLSYNVHGQIWTQWNQAKDIQYGIINRGTNKGSAMEACQSENFDNLVTIRSLTERIELVQMIFEYNEDISNQETKKQESSLELYYWLGIQKEQIATSPQSFITCWLQYDGLVATFTEWQNNFPVSRSNWNCVLLRHICQSTCSLRWINQDCNNTLTANIIVCERREILEQLDDIEKQVNSNYQVNAWFIQRWTELIYFSSTNSNQTLNKVLQGIRVLFLIASKNSTIQVTEKTIENVIKTSQSYHDYIALNYGDFTKVQLQSIVKTLELFLDRVNIKPPNVILRFETLSFRCQVQYVNNYISEDIVFPSDETEAPYIRVPIEAIRMSNTVGMGNKSRLFFIHYRDSILFGSKYSVSQVVSAQVDRQHVTGLRTPVMYKLPLSSHYLSKKKHELYVQCSFWDFNDTSWSKEGCYVISRQPDLICGCDHLTNFAILVQVFQRPSSKPFDNINAIIGAISCAGFFLTAIIYVSFRELRRSKPGFVHINFCLCYGMGYLVFIIASDYRETSTPCVGMTITVHYLFLSGWLWTFSEAYTMYLLIVKKLHSLGDNYNLYISLISYLIPFVVVAVNVGLTIGYYDTQSIDGFVPLSEDDIVVNSTYVSGSSCWLTGYSLYFGFLTEGAIILATNAVIYISVLRSITWGREKIQSSRSKSSSIESLCTAVTIGAMLGLIWTITVPLELLAQIPVLEDVLTYIFSVLIAAQGIIIFYLFCMRRQTVRQLWWNPIWMLLRRFLPFKADLLKSFNILVKKVLFDKLQFCRKLNEIKEKIETQNISRTDNTSTVASTVEIKAELC